MLKKVSTVFLLLSTVVGRTNAQYYQTANGIDVVGLLSPSQFSCIKSMGFSAIFTQIYSDKNGGSLDFYGFRNLDNAHRVGLRTEVYISPAPQNFSKQGGTQFYEAYNHLKQDLIDVRTIWLKVTNPPIWTQNISYNIDFIQGMITRAKSYNVTLGIFTNWYDWHSITGSTSAFEQYYLPLWYWDVYGFGSRAESPSNFFDFRSFGSFYAIKAKEYSLNDWFCSAVLSKVIYFKSNSNFELTSNRNMSQPIAGSAIF